MKNLSRGPIAWWKSIGLAIAALYVPFVAMGIYTLFFVSCSHCKKAVWQLMQLAPGLVPGVVCSQWLLPRKSEWALWTTTGVIELLMLFGVTLLVRRGGICLVTTLIVTLLITSFLAVVVLEMIQA